MTREQFDHIVRVLKKKNIPVTKENIKEYLLSTKRQEQRFYKRIISDKAEKANRFRAGCAEYIMAIKWRKRFAGFEFLWYKKGYKGLIGRFDIVRVKGGQ